MSVSTAEEAGADAASMRKGRVYRWGALCLALALLWLPASTHAGTKYGWGGAFGEEIRETFFVTDSSGELRVAPTKVNRYRELIERKRRVLEQHFINYETIEKGVSEKKARSNLPGRDTMVALDYIVELLDRIDETTDSVAAFDAASQILMLEFATRSFTEPLASLKIPVHVKNLFDEWRLPNGTHARRSNREASNLINPDTGEFHTTDELAALTRSGFDISELDPPAETHFWRKRDEISRVDITHDYLNGGDPMHEGIVSEFPPFDGAVFELDEAHKTQSKPKLDVYYLDADCRQRSRKKQKKCRQRIKLKFGMETHSDPPSNALLGALGFNIDVSMHLKNVRVNLGKDGFEDLDREWIGYFDRQRIHTYIPLESVVRPGAAGRGTDEQGDYLIFTEAVAELKPPEVDRIGVWSFGSGMASESREARGMFVFNAWIGNADMKDEENNKLTLRKNSAGEMQMYLVQQDLGHSMGWILPEKPDSFPWDLVEPGVVSGLMSWFNRSIELDYVNLQDAGLEETTTHADAKWMVRLIAQLTREQIEEAIGLGHWPGGIPQLYVEKLINRRNQLVEAFGLEEELALMPVDRQLTTADGSVVDGILVRNRWDDESPISFDDHWEAAWGPVGDWFIDRAGQALQLGIATVDVINPGNVQLSGKLALFPRVLANFSRQVRLNPEPEGAFDQYIVFDSIEVGLRVGVGYIGSVEGTLVKRYAIAYPVATLRDGIYADPDVASFLLPYRARKAELPEKYVLLRENAYRAGFRVSTDHTPFLSPFGMDGGQNWVWSQRSVIDRRGEAPIVWVDAPRSIDREAHMFLELAVLQVPFLGGGTSDGTLEGELFKVDPEKLDTVADDGVPLFERMIRRADFDGIEAILLEPPRTATAEFLSRDVWWNILVAYGRDRTTEQRMVLYDDAGSVVRDEQQVERRNFFTWSFLDNGETQSFRVTGYVGSPDSSDPAPSESAVVVSFTIDDLNTHSNEFDDYYALLRKLGSGETYLAPEFRAADWEISGEEDGVWTRLQTSGTVELQAGAIDRLVHVDADRHWRLLAKNLGLSDREFARHLALSGSSTSKDTLVARRSLSGRRIRSLIRRSRGVMKILDEASVAANDLDRIRLVVRAVFRSSFKSGATYDPILLSTFLEQCGMRDLIEREQIRVKARVTKAFEDEQNLPERRDIVGKLGDGKYEEVNYRLFPIGGLQLYKMLDWVSATE